jgi:hypothetical protein
MPDAIRKVSSLTQLWEEIKSYMTLYEFGHYVKWKINKTSYIAWRCAIYIYIYIYIYIFVPFLIMRFKIVMIMNLSEVSS